MTAPCVHDWQPYPGREAVFHENLQMWTGERAHVMCAKCKARTWLSRDELASRLPAPVPTPDGAA